MIVITGALGFIGSCTLSYFNQKGIRDIIAVDDFTQKHKFKNLAGRQIQMRIDRENFPVWLASNALQVDFVIHLGARTDTAEFDEVLLNHLNLHYTQQLWTICATHQIPLIYASSAATYGLGELGYRDSHDIVPNLKPLNPYGYSKNAFDSWALTQQMQPPFWAGLKFFNVYGPNEYHKKRMASVMYHFFHAIQRDGKVRLFRSHRVDVQDGEQQRDFIYVMDVVQIIYQLFQHKESVKNGLYNIGTGQARSYLDLTHSLFKVLGQKPNIEFIDTPADIRDKYQYFTEADMTKLNALNLGVRVHALEEGIEDYVTSFLKTARYF